MRDPDSLDNILGESPSAMDVDNGSPTPTQTNEVDPTDAEDSDSPARAPSKKKKSSTRKFDLPALHINSPIKNPGTDHLRSSSPIKRSQQQGRSSTSAPGRAFLTPSRSSSARSIQSGESFECTREDLDELMELLKPFEKVDTGPFKQSQQDLPKTLEEMLTPLIKFLGRVHGEIDKEAVKSHKVSVDLILRQ